MGGGAFLNAQAEGQSTLQTRRMSPEEYQHLKITYLERLRAYFGKDHVSCLIEAPEKDDYGDIDMEVATSELIDWTEVATQIGAVAWLERGSPKHQKCSIAVRMNGERSAVSPPMYTPIHDDKQRKRIDSPVPGVEEYAQIDIEKIPPELKAWRAFQGSYGDLAGIIGNITTVYGFTLSDYDFRLRFAEADTCKNDPEWKHIKLPVEDGRIFLSSDPDAVMGFLGLDVARYHAGFQTVEEVFQWLSGCRMISDRFLKKDTGETARDRQKAFRSMFNQFFDDWLPEHLEAKSKAARQLLPPASTCRPDETPENSEEFIKCAENPNTLRSTLRAKYLEEALDYFKVHDIYDKTHDAFLRKRDNEQAAYLLRPVIALHSGKAEKKAAEILRAFRRNVAFVQDEGPVISHERTSDAQSRLHTFLNADGGSLQDECVVDEWVKENWDRVKAIERERAAREKDS